MFSEGRSIGNGFWVFERRLIFFPGGRPGEGSFFVSGDRFLGENKDRGCFLVFTSLFESEEEVRVIGGCRGGV